MEKIKFIGIVSAALVLCTSFVCKADNTQKISIADVSGAEHVTIAKNGVDFAYVRKAEQPIKAPFSDNGIVYMSLRDLAGIEKSPIKWNAYTGEATVYYLKYELVVSEESDAITKKENSQNSVSRISMRSAAKLIDGTIYVPVESFAEATGRVCLFDGDYIVYGRENFTSDRITATDNQDKFDSLNWENINAGNIMKTFYVDSAKGYDENPGTSDEPFATINGARLYIEKFKQENPMSGDIVVYIRGGEYPQKSSLTFNESDSGENGYRIKYTAYPNETPVLNSGTKISGWSIYDAQKNIYRAYIGKGADVRSITDNDEAGVVARIPNDGYYVAKSVESGPSKSEFIYNENELPELKSTKNLRVFMWAGGDNGEIRWSSKFLNVSSLDSEKRDVTLSDKATYTVGTGSEYYFENEYEFLDTPGEFYVSEDGWIYYIPRGGDIENRNIYYADNKSNIMDITSTGKVVRNIDFCGLSFTGTDRRMTAAKINRSDNITFDGCNFYELGNDAVYITYSRDITVKNSNFKKIGGSGVVIGNYYVNTDVVQQGYCSVTNNRFDTFGDTFGECPAVDIPAADYNYIANNYIINGKRFAIQLIGGSLGGVSPDDSKDKISPRGNVISGNYIDNVMDYTEDGGAIYAYVTGGNNVIRRNCICNTSIKASFGFLIYLDDGAGNYSVYDNVLVNNQQEKTKGNLGGLIVMKGLNNTVYNNIAYNNQNGEEYADANVTAGMTLPMANMPNNSILFSKNVFSNSADQLIRIGKNLNSQYKDPPETRMRAEDYNVFYNDRGKYSVDVSSADVKNMEDWLLWQKKKYDQNSLIGTDPGFVNAALGDLRFSYNSPVYGLGIRDIDFGDIGYCSDNKFVDNTGAIAKLYIKEEKTGNNSRAELSIGEETQLTLSGRCEDLAKINMADAKCTFASGDPGIASVDENGKVTAVSAGTAEITSSASYGGNTCTTSFWVTVSDKITSVELNVPTAAYTPGDKCTAYVKAKTSSGSSTVPADIKYSSSDSDIASVDENGIVTINKTGSTEITASVTVAGEEITDTKTVTSKDIVFDKIYASVDNDICKTGSTVKVNVKAKDNKGNDFPTENVNVKFEDLEGISVSGTELTFNKAGIYAVGVSGTADGKKSSRIVYMNVVDDDTADTDWKVSSYGSNIKGELEMTKNNEFAFRTSGIDLWQKSDSGSVAYKKFVLSKTEPKAEIIAEFHSFPGAFWEDGTKSSAQVGVTIREKDEAGSKNATLRWGEADAQPFTWRDKTNGDYQYKSGEAIQQDHVWMRLVRDGKTFTAYYKLNEDDDWTETGTAEIDMSNDVLIGICGYSKFEDKENGAIGKLSIKTGDEVITEKTSDTADKK